MIDGICGGEQHCETTAEDGPDDNLIMCLVVTNMSVYNWPGGRSKREAYGVAIISSAIMLIHYLRRVPWLLASLPRLWGQYAICPGKRRGCMCHPHQPYTASNVVQSWIIHQWRQEPYASRVFWPSANERRHLALLIRTCISVSKGSTPKANQKRRWHILLRGRQQK